MSRRTLVFAVLAVLISGVFIRLGFWQLSRRNERLARNAYVGTRLDSAAVPFWTLPRDSARVHYRRVVLTGTPDFAHEFYAVDRSHYGSPGVYVLTPVRVPGQDTAVLVNRGWVYAPDGETLEADRWHAPDSLFVGYIEEFQPPVEAHDAATASAPSPTAVSYDAIAHDLPLSTRAQLSSGWPSAMTRRCTASPCAFSPRCWMKAQGT